MRLILQKYSLLLLTILPFIWISCSSEPNYFSDRIWYIKDYTINENNKIEMRERIFIKNDSVYSYSYVERKNLVYPLIRINDRLIIKTISPLNYEGHSVTKDTLLIDTVYFRLQKVMVRQVLLLNKKNSNYLKVLKPDQDLDNFDESSKNIKLIEFKVDGISIGDTLDPKELTFEDDKYYGIENNILIASLKNDNKIKLELIEKNIVYGIKQETIEKESLVSIISVVNTKLGIPPDTIKMKEESYTEGYKWERTDISIELTRTAMSKYYVDLAKKTDDYGVKKLFAQLAIAQLDEEKYWTLKYDNKLSQQVLQLYSDKNPVSHIIE